jgi:hypothetical protein
MEPGHIFTVEPMINEGTHENTTLEDGWTVVTADGKRSAQFEHTLLITETGFLSLSLSLSLTHTHTLSLSLSHTHTHTRQVTYDSWMAAISICKPGKSKASL